MTRRVVFLELPQSRDFDASLSLREKCSQRKGEARELGGRRWDGAREELLARWAKRPGLTEEDRALIRDWIDGGFRRIAGSDEVRQFLKRWLNQKPLSEWECNQMREWIDKPDSQRKRDELFMVAAKRAVVGHVTYEIVKERQKSLSPRAWIVAWAIAQGLTRKQILTLIGRKGVRTVANSIREIKDKMYSKGPSLNLAEITRWFFGH